MTLSLKQSKGSCQLQKKTTGSQLWEKPEDIVSSVSKNLFGEISLNFKANILLAFSLLDFLLPFSTIPSCYYYSLVPPTPHCSDSSPFHTFTPIFLLLFSFHLLSTSNCLNCPPKTLFLSSQGPLLNLLNTYSLSPIYTNIIVNLQDSHRRKTCVISLSELGVPQYNIFHFDSLSQKFHNLIFLYR